MLPGHHNGYGPYVNLEKLTIFRIPGFLKIKKITESHKSQEIEINSELTLS